MGSWQALVLRPVLRFAVKRPLAKHTRGVQDAVRTARRVFETGSGRNARVPHGARVVTVDEGGVRGEWVLAGAEPRERVILLVHGGGFVACTPLGYRRFALALARASGAPVFVVDYRRAPEHPYPAALGDVLAAYDALRARIPAAGIALVGDSAGGGLVLSALHALRARDGATVDFVACAVAYSPWTDLLLTGTSLVENARSDDMLVPAAMPLLASAYATPGERRSPLASPLYGTFAGFPRTRIYASTTEALRDDASRLADRARAQGAPVELVLEPSLPHVWPLFFEVLPEGRRTLAESAAFLQRCWAAAARAPVTA